MMTPEQVRTVLALDCNIFPFSCSQLSLTTVLERDDLSKQEFQALVKKLLPAQFGHLNAHFKDDEFAGMTTAQILLLLLITNGALFNGKLPIADIPAEVKESPTVNHLIRAIKCPLRKEHKDARLKVLQHLTQSVTPAGLLEKYPLVFTFLATHLAEEDKSMKLLFDWV